MKKITIFLAFGFLLFFNETKAQQDPQYTQYMYNMNVVNPAYAGSRGTLSLGLLGRTQWTSIDGAPKTLTFNAHAPLGKKVGVGISVIGDEIGPAKEQNIYADFSYTLTTSDVGRLAFGLKAGVTLLNVNLLDVVLPETNNAGDPIFDENINDAFPNFGQIHSNKFPIFYKHLFVFCLKMCFLQFNQSKLTITALKSIWGVKRYKCGT